MWSAVQNVLCKIAVQKCYAKNAVQKMLCKKCCAKSAVQFCHTWLDNNFSHKNTIKIINQNLKKNKIAIFLYELCTDLALDTYLNRKFK